MITTTVQYRLGRGLRGRAIHRAVESFFRQARVIIAQDEAERFRSSTAPDGTPWPPLKATTRNHAVRRAIAKLGGRQARPIVYRTRSGVMIARARHPIPGYQRTARVRRTTRSLILVDTGRLRNSVVSAAATADAIRRQNRALLEWGTRVPYGADHQYGAPQRNLPPRPFLGVSPPANNRLQQAFALTLQQAVR